MIITTTDSLPGHEVNEVLGLVQGSVVRARFVGRDFIAGLRTLIGGEVSEYTKLMAESREQALDRLKQNAAAIGADAVLNLRFATSMIMQGTSEILVYGTAVKLK
jgi:uncharacterized protein YbjQ (UPF0145 family)